MYFETLRESSNDDRAENERRKLKRIENDSYLPYFDMTLSYSMTH